MEGRVGITLMPVSKTLRWRAHWTGPDGKERSKHYCCPQLAALSRALKMFVFVELTADGEAYFITCSDERGPRLQAPGARRLAQNPPAPLPFIQGPQAPQRPALRPPPDEPPPPPPPVSTDAEIADFRNAVWQARGLAHLHRLEEPTARSRSQLVQDQHELFVQAARENGAAEPSPPPKRGRASGPIPLRREPLAFTPEGLVRAQEALFAAAREAGAASGGP